MLAEQVVSVLLLTTVIVTMAAQVIWRYVLQSPLSWSEEVARLAMIWLTFIAASFVLATRQHIVVDVIGDGYPPSGRVGACSGEGPRACQTEPVSCLMRLIRSRWPVTCLVLAGALGLLIGGMSFVLRVYPVGSPSVNISMTFWYAAPLVGLGLMSLHLIADLLGIDSAPPAPPASGN